MTPSTKLHRGDRVIDLGTGQRAVVEGWKDGKVFVLFGTDRGLDFRGWLPWWDFVLDKGQDVTALEDLDDEEPLS